MPTSAIVITGLTAVGGVGQVVLTWSYTTPPGQGCLSYMIPAAFKVYEGTSPGFTPGPGNLIATVPTSAYVRLGLNNTQTRHYKVAAVDPYGFDGVASAAASATPLAVSSADIPDGSITKPKLATGAVSKDKFEVGITPVEIFTSLPSTGNYEGRTGNFLGKLYRYTGSGWTAAVPAVDVQGQITSTQIADDAITTPKIATNAITANEMAANSVTFGKVAADAIDTNAIRAAAISSGKIATAAIVAGKIDVGAINVSSLIVDGVVITGKIATQAVTRGNTVTNPGSAIFSLTATNYVDLKIDGIPAGSAVNLNACIVVGWTFADSASFGDVDFWIQRGSPTEGLGTVIGTKKRVKVDDSWSTTVSWPCTDNSPVSGQSYYLLAKAIDSGATIQHTGSQGTIQWLLCQR